VVTSLLDLGARAQALRSAFDRAFSEPPTLAAASTEDLLAIRVAGDSYALRVSELSGLVSNRKVVALPTRAPHLLGIAGVRGALVPVYALAGLLGYDVARSPGQWLALCGRQEPVALAFEELEGFLRVPSAHLHPVGVELSKQHVAEGVRVGGVTRRVIDTRSALEALQGFAGLAGKTKDR
jgi:chemotaxis signal transduction protein